MTPTLHVARLAAVTLTLGAAFGQGSPPQPRVEAPVLTDAVAPEAAGGETLAVYDVCDLTGHAELEALAKDIVNDALSQTARVALLEKYRTLVEAGGPRARMQQFVESIEALISPPFAGGSQQVQALGDDTLTVMGTPAQQQWVRDYLGALRTVTGFYDVKATIYILEEGRLGKLMGGLGSAVLDAPAAERLRGEVGDADVLTAPRILVVPGQRATLSVVDQTAYIKDYEVTVLPGQATEIADPVIEVLQTGLVLELDSAPLGKGRAAMKAELSLSHADRPFPEAKVKVGTAGSEVTIQLPEVHSVKATGRFDLTLGNAVAFGTRAPAGGVMGAEDNEEREVLVVIEVSHVESLPEGEDSPLPPTPAGGR